MKIMKTVKKIKLSGVLFLFLGLGVFNQTKAQTTNYNWDSYGLSFTVPSTHEVKQSGSAEFESGDNKTWIEIYPYKDYSATPQSMIDKVVSTEGFAIESKGDYSSGKFKGRWVRATTPKHPTWKFWVIGFIDPDSDVNFYTIIWWKKGDSSAYNLAYDMSYSFK